MVSKKPNLKRESKIYDPATGEIISSDGVGVVLEERLEADGLSGGRNICDDENIGKITHTPTKRGKLGSVIPESGSLQKTHKRTFPGGDSLERKWIKKD